MNQILSWWHVSTPENLILLCQQLREMDERKIEKEFGLIHILVWRHQEHQIYKVGLLFSLCCFFICWENDKILENCMVAINVLDLCCLSFNHCCKPNWIWSSSHNQTWWLWLMITSKDHLDWIYCFQSREQFWGCFLVSVASEDAMFAFFCRLLKFWVFFV